jgi:hypothetical protein
MTDLGDAPHRAVEAAVMEPSLPDGAVQHVEAAAALEQARLVAAAQGRHAQLLQRPGRRAPRPVPAHTGPMAADLGHIWMRSSLAVRASDCQCRSRNSPGFDPSILRHSGI